MTFDKKRFIMLAWKRVTANVSVIVALAMGVGVGVANATPPLDAPLASEEGVHVIYEDKDSIIIALDELPPDVQCKGTDLADFNELSNIKPTAIGDPYPQNPSAKVCLEAYLSRADLQAKGELYTPKVSQAAKVGYWAALTAVGEIVARKGIPWLGATLGLIDTIRIKPEEWWKETLAMAFTGQIRGVEMKIYCNYSGGYPRAYKILKRV